MRIHGFQKMTMLDYPGKVACTVFTGGCNLRCPFCHNALLVTGLADCPPCDEEEIFAYLGKRRGILDGVCLTGGEPLMNPDVAELLARIRELGYAVKVDTNGCYPDRLRAIVEAGLVDYVAMDVKNRPEKYAATVGIPGFDTAAVEESVAFLKEGKVDCEFRTTVVAELHTAEDIAAIAQWIAGAPRYFLQCFKPSERMIAGDALHAPDPDVLLKMKKMAEVCVPTEVRGTELTAD